MEEGFVDQFFSVEMDEDYEFDASHFYDFTRPENHSEIQEVERWFEVSGDYPHSPFVVKLNLEKILCPQVEAKSDSKNTKPRTYCSDSDNKRGVSNSKRNDKEKGSSMLQEAAKAKKKLADKSPQQKRSNFMEPTASHLAKLPKEQGQKNSSNLCTRFQRRTTKFDQMRSPDNLATKRQKLETGYLKKGSGLKHQFFLSHKSSKKVTVPREPELETPLRAQRRRSKNSCVSSENEKQKQPGCNFKAQSPNIKILHAHSLPIQRKRKPQSPDLQQVPHSKTIQRDNRRSSAKENKLSAGDKLSDKLIGQFNELSLRSNLETHNASPLQRHSSAKGLNKDGSDSFQAEFCRRHSKLNQFGHMRVHEASMIRIASN